MGFEEVADRVWVARYPWFDVNVTAIGGSRGLVLVDTHASGRAATQVVADLRSLGVGDVVEIVNTHEHFDHWFGNAVVLEEYGDLPRRAHETAVERAPAAAARILAAYLADPDDPHAGEVAATVLAPPTETFSSAAVVDLGDRAVELIHPGRGHTAGDLVVIVPDADVVLMGDLVEESADRDATPGLGPDSWPLEWPLTLDVVLGLITPVTVVVPGHGAIVDRDFVERQRDAIGFLAETVRDLAGRGVRVEDALGTVQEWPFPVQYLDSAVRRIYEQLPRSQKRLPLI